MKKKLKIIIICMLILLIFIIGSLTLAEESFNPFKSGTTILDQDSISILANVDGIGITKASFELAKELTLEPNISDEEILDSLIREHVILNEADRLNISISIEQAEKHVNDIYSQMNEMLNSSNQDEVENAKLVLEDLSAFAKGMSLTDDEYKQKYVVPRYQRILTKTALYNHFTSSLSIDEQKDMNIISKRYNEYIQSLIDSANIEIVQQNS